VTICLTVMTRRMTKSPGRYRPFLRRQEADLKAFHEDEDLVLDPHMDYSTVAGISSEVKEKLAAIRPTTIVGGQLRSIREVFTSIPGCG
jgi:tRNA U34 5-carboxymethylaminomethyl modifying enzyme MnmG/GidA